MIIEEFTKSLNRDIDEYIKTREQQAEKELIFSGGLTPEIEEFAKNLKNDIDEFIKEQELGYGLIRNECVFDVFNVSAGKPESNYIIYEGI